MSQEKSTKSISGKIDAIIYDGREKGNDFVIFSVSSPTGIPGKYEKTKVVGSASSLVKVGSYVDVNGELEVNQYGEQIKLKSIKLAQVDYKKMKEDYKRNALIKILGSHYFQGIGDAAANRIVNTTNMMDMENPLEVLRDSNALQLMGSPKMIESIMQSFEINPEEIDSVYKIMALSDHITFNQARNSLEDIGVNAHKMIKENPYELIKVDGISFHTADDIALTMGIERGSSEQIYAATIFSLRNASTQSGHSYLSNEVLKNNVSKLISKTVSVEQIKEALGEFTLTEDNVKVYKDIVEKDNNFYLRKFYELEIQVAKDICRLMNGSISPEAQAKLSAIAQSIRESNGELESGIKLSEEQVNSVASSIEEKISITTGGPGVGKTTVTENTMKGLVEAGLSRFSCVSPTGKAAKRMEESIKREAKTIHRELEYNPKEISFDLNGNPTFFQRNSSNPLDSDVIMIDESSMMDLEITAALLSAAPDNAKVIFIGDVDQLESVGAGNVLSDLIDCNKIHVNRLTQIYRQGPDSGVAVKAHQLNNGQSKEFFEDLDEYFDINFTEINGTNAAALAKKQGVSKGADDYIADFTIVKFKKMAELGFDVYDDIQILTPMRKGLAGTYNLNRRIRDVANPNSLNKENPKISTPEYIFFEGDKIMQIKNDKETKIMNGEQGKIVSISKKEVMCDFDGKSVSMSHKEFIAKIEPAWAMTIHKSQGSEYKGVILPVSKAHTNMMFRAIPFTGMTRGKKKVEVVGDKNVLISAILDNKKRPRNTTLDTAIIEEFNKSLDVYADEEAFNNDSFLDINNGLYR